MTYSSRLRASLDPKHPCNTNFGSKKNRVLPDEYIEKIYLKQLYGSSKKPEICKICNIAKSRSGCCDC